MDKIFSKRNKRKYYKRSLYPPLYIIKWYRLS